MRLTMQSGVQVRSRSLNSVPTYRQYTEIVAALGSPTAPEAAVQDGGDGACAPATTGVDV